jgi:tRNA/tmRNA/rRNA uracil-C5-methylase (TrmA/RlmC/RlmD family)
MTYKTTLNIENSEKILRIADLSRGGAGVARDPEGRVIFVPFTAPGDLVRIRITEVDKRFAQAELLEILEPSPIRQRPRCPAFGQCGGCQWQHLSYEKQWETKTKGVFHALKRVQVNPPASCDLIPAEQIWEYRNRVQLRGNSTQLGFYKQGTHELVSVERCDIARPEINESWKETVSQGKRLSKPYKVEVEVLPGELREVRRSWNKQHSASGFRQVHDSQNEMLRNWISKAIGKTQVLYDLYGGSGNLSLPLVDQAGEIHCVDLGAPKTHPAGVPPHVHFYSTAVMPWLLRRTKNLQNRDFPQEADSASSFKGAAILDPPREGLGRDFSEIESALKLLNVKKIIAVGCDADAWAKDLSKWLKKGWNLERLMLIDLFPQTSHIESIALLAL